MTHLAELAQTLRRSLQADIGVGVTDPRAPAPKLLPAEEPATARMRGKRRREFAAGRTAARAAMADLGLPPAPIPMNPDRTPRWPEGLCGSISHSATAAIALVANCTEVPGLGIDIEEDTGLPPDLWPEILTPSELDWVSRQPMNHRDRRAKEIFSAKEAVHKLHYPLSGRLLGFDEVTITLDTQGFWTRLPLEVPSLPEVITGKILRMAGLVVAVLANPRIDPERNPCNRLSTEGACGMR